MMSVPRGALYSIWILASALVALLGGGCAPPSGAAPALPAPAPSPPAAAVHRGSAGAEGEQQIADLGTCALESGEKIVDCQVGYRTFGKLDGARSNVVLWPTWFTGTTGRLVDVVPGKLLDTGRFYLVLVDSLGDGVSSSPSNSKAQPRLSFPRFGIRDMVESQRRLLTEKLGISHVRAVMGISMGGMQAFQWAVSHPGFMDRIVPIVGSPQLTSHDLLLWTAELHALTSDVAYKDGEYQGRPLLRAVQDIHQLALTTPEYRSSKTSRAAFPGWLDGVESDTRFDWNDWRRQLEAMLAHDVAAPFGGSLEEAARRVSARALVVVAEQDHAVNPLPALTFARQLGASTWVLKSKCAHIAPGCEEQAALAAAIHDFVTSR